jgi:hypothetical protein
MLRPSPGELLGGICASLRRSVLPALPPGDSQRQLRAALHALERLQRCWDLLPECLAADIADMRATLQEIVTAARQAPGGEPPALSKVAADIEGAGAAHGADMPDAIELPGIHDAAMAAAARTHAALQALVAEADRCLRVSATTSGGHASQLEALDRLYQRMTERELRVTGAQEADA